MNRIKIGDRWIGEGEPCLIVAEVGSNHNGSLDQALAIIDAAKEAKADAVKFQNFRADKLYPRNAGTSDYLPVKKPIYDIIKTMEMPSEWIPVLTDYCKARDLIFFSAPFDEESADKLEPYVQVYKIASYEITHAPLIRHVARKRKPMILSTGTADLAEVRQALEWCRAEGNDQVILLQCTASYPAPPSSLNIRALVTMRETLGVPTGLSDHSRDPLVAPLAAVALGANVIEKHLTLSNNLPGPDHAYAVEPGEFATMVTAVRNAEQALGDGIKVTQSVEQELHQFARRSIYAIRSIKKGEKFTVDNIAVLRCGKLTAGLAPKHWEQILGRTASKDIAEGSPIDETAASLRLRKATELDGPFLLAVRNHPEVRAQSKNQDVIPETTHHAWLQAQFKSPANAIWIVEGGGQPEGYIRGQNIGNGTWLLSIALDQPFRGRGHGSWAVREACRMLKEIHGACCLAAEVFSTNSRARQLFKDAGFVPTADFMERGLAMTRFELPLGMAVR